MKPTNEAIEAALLAAKTVLRNNEITIDSAIFAAVTAAFAAQFPPSEDYAELVKNLRIERGCIASPDDCLAAADALEALLAERDALKSELIDYKDAAASEADFVNEQAEKIRELKAERDALLARLAPVDEEALVEIARQAILKETDECVGIWPTILVVAIAAIRPHIEAAVREKIAETVKYWGDEPRFQLLAAAIRSGK